MLAQPQTWQTTRRTAPWDVTPRAGRRFEFILTVSHLKEKKKLM